MSTTVFMQQSLKPNLKMCLFFTNFTKIACKNEKKQTWWSGLFSQGSTKMLSVNQHRPDFTGFDSFTPQDSRSWINWALKKVKEEKERRKVTGSCSHFPIWTFLSALAPFSPPHFIANEQAHKKSQFDFSLLPSIACSSGRYQSLSFAGLGSCIRSADLLLH